jgi:hypothetical protein
VVYAFVARIAGNVPVSFISLICKSIPFSARFDVFCIVKGALSSAKRAPFVKQ